MAPRHPNPGIMGGPGDPGRPLLRRAGSVLSRFWGLATQEYRLIRGFREVVHCDTRSCHMSLMPLQLGLASRRLAGFGRGGAGVGGAGPPLRANFGTRPRGGGQRFKICRDLVAVLRQVQLGRSAQEGFQGA